MEPDDPSSKGTLRAVRMTRDHDRKPFDRRLVWLAGGFAVYSLLLAVFTSTQPISGYAFVTITDVAGVIAPLIAAALALYASDRADDQLQLGWLLIGLGCLCWGIGDGAWAYYEVILRSDVPFPSAADVGYLTMLPLTAAGVICFSFEGRRMANARPTLDGLAFALACAGAVWFLVLAPTYADSSATVLEKAISGAYPMGDVVLAYALVAGAARQWASRERGVLLTLLGGVLLLIVADVGFAYLTLNARYSATSLINVAWPAGFLLIGYAAALSTIWQPRFVQEEDLGNAPSWTRSIPIALIPGMMVLDAVAWRGESWEANVPLLVMTGVSTVAIVVRQSINFGLLEQFEATRASALSWFDKRAA